MGNIWKWIASVGVAAASLGSVACLVLMLDEPEMPKSMIK